MRSLRAVSALLLATTGLAAPNKWVHPGVLVGPDRLAHIKAQVAAGKNVIAHAYRKALDSTYGALDYSPQGPPSNGIIDCGSYSNPDYGCSAEDSDGAAAVTQLLLFAINGTKTYAANAVRILDEYGSRLKQYTNSNAPLQAAWGLSKWARAAELARHLPGVNWAAVDADAFTAMLYRVSLPLVVDGSGDNGNWELSMVEGAIGLAVLSENATLFDRAAGFWQQRVPAYFYNFELDGSAPRPAPRGHPSWYGQAVFNASTSGVAQETCRDEGHTTYSVAAASNAAETALIQGLDLWAPNAQRLATAFEFNARLLLPGVKPPAYLCSGAGVKLAQYPSYIVAYYALSQRAGGPRLPMPNAAAHIQGTVLGLASQVDPHMMVFEALTHGA